MQRNHDKKTLPFTHSTPFEFQCGEFLGNHEALCYAKCASIVRHANPTGRYRDLQSNPQEVGKHLSCKALKDEFLAEEKAPIKFVMKRKVGFRFRTPRNSSVMIPNKWQASWCKFSFGLQSFVLFIIVHSITVWYLFSHFEFTQGAAVERLSEKGWIFSHLPTSQTSATQDFLSRFFPEHYVQPIMAARLPKGFKAGQIKDSEADLVLIKNLRMFSLVGGSISAEDLQTIGKLSLVEELHIERCEFDCDDGQIGGVVAKLQRVQRVHLIKKGANAGVVHGLAKIRDLRAIRMGNLTAKDICVLMNLPRLERLSYRGVTFPETVEVLSDFGKVIVAKTLRERKEMAGKHYQGSILTLKRRGLPDLIVD